MAASRDNPGGADGGHPPEPAFAGRCIAAVNTVAVAAFAWTLYYPRPYLLAVGLQAALPLLALLFSVIFKGRVRFEGRAWGRRPSLSLLFTLPVLALALRAVRDWHILDWGRFWTPIAVIGSALAVLVFACAADVRKKAAVAIFVFCLCFAYSYGLLLPLNCYDDRSWPTAYASKVLSHRVSYGRRSTTYYLNVSPWLNRPEVHQVPVHWSVYNGHPDGDAVRIVVHGGRLGFPWYLLY